jgi:hypothetical protein
MDKGETARREMRYVFECAWEVANKVGGIYTVLRTKAVQSTEELGDQYCMMGPYNADSVRLEVEVLEADAQPMRAALQFMKDEGFKVRGGWRLPLKRMNNFYLGASDEHFLIFNSNPIQIQLHSSIFNFNPIPILGRIEQKNAK